MLRRWQRVVIGRAFEKGFHRRIKRSDQLQSAGVFRPEFGRQRGLLFQSRLRLIDYILFVVNVKNLREKIPLFESQRQSIVSDLIHCCQLKNERSRSRIERRIEWPEDLPVDRVRWPLHVDDDAVGAANEWDFGSFRDWNTSSADRPNTRHAFVCWSDNRSSLGIEEVSTGRERRRKRRRSAAMNENELLLNKRFFGKRLYTTYT